MARFWTLPKHNRFWEAERANIEFSDSDKIRLNPRTNRIELKIGIGGYPTDANIHAIGPAMGPDAVRQWIGFQADVVIPKDINGAPVGFLKYRLHDGTNQWYWDGDSWEQGAGSNWNTEAEVAANISSYNAMTTRVLRIVVNLSTTDSTRTPATNGVKLAYKADIESHLDDLLYRTLAPAMKTSLRPAADFLGSANGTSEVDFGAVLGRVRVPFDVVDIDAVWDITDDPNRLTDLFSSYSSGTQTITLTGSVTSGHRLHIRGLYRPDVVIIGTHPDYTEVEKVPAVHMVNPTVMRSRYGHSRIEVVNKDAGTALVWPEPRQDDIQMEVIMLAPGGTDLQRLRESVDQFLRANRILRTTGTDEPVQLWALPTQRYPSLPGGEGLFTASMVLEARDVLNFDRRALTSSADGVYPILTVKVTGDMDLEVALEE